MKINLVVTADGLKCYQDADYEALKRAKLKNGTVVECVVKEFRNIKFHRLYFSLLNCAWEYLDESQRQFFKENVELFREAVQVAAGHSEKCYSITRNEWFERPKSIAFDKMTESDFSALYDRVKDIIYHYFIPQVNKEEFEGQLRWY